MQEEINPEKLLLTKQLELNSMLEVTQAINSNLPAEKLFRIYEFILRGQMGIEKLAFFISDGDKQSERFSWECVCMFGVDEMIKNLDINKELINIKENTKIKHTNNELLNQFQYIIPIYHQDKPLAYSLIATDKDNPEEEHEGKIRFIETITSIIGVAVENQKFFIRQLEQEGLKRELELAAKMQTMLIPTDLPKNEHYEMAAVYLPDQEVGGDYYDYIPINKDEYIFCIADISGKGIAAALLMASFQATLRAMAKQKISSENFIKILNKNVNKITKGDKFITLFIAKYNFRTRKMIYVNAGHNPPLLLAKGKISKLKKGTTILGMFEKLPFLTIGEIVLEPNSFLFNYTDGLTDLENEQNERFEDERLIDFLKENASMDIEKLNQKLIDYVVSFKGKMLFVDDITILSCRFF